MALSMKSHIVLLIGLMCSAVWAQEFTNFGIRAHSLAGAYRAIALGNDAIAYNPAGIARHRRYELNIDYRYGFSINEHQPGVSIVDSTTGPLAVGLSYDLGVYASENPLQLSQLAQITFAGAPVSELVYIGATGKYIALPMFEGAQSASRLTFDVGVLIQTPVGFTLAGVAYNLVPTKTARVPMDVAVAAAVDFGRLIGIEHNNTKALGAMGGFTLAFDWLMSNLMDKQHQEQTLMAAAEVFLFEAWPLRAGYRWDKTPNTSTLAFGTGFVIPELAIDLLYEQGITRPKERQVGISIKVYV